MNKVLTLLAVILTFTSFSQSINDSLLLYYPLNGDAIDASGNDFNGLLNASSTEDRFGNVNGAFQFNGVDQYIDFPLSDDLKPELPVSFSFWVKFDDLQAENTVIFTTDYAQDNHSGVWMNLSSTGIIALNLGDGEGNTASFARRSVIGSSLLEADIWYHVVGVVRGPIDMDIHIDCSLENAQYSGSGAKLGYTSNAGSIGRKDANPNLPAYYFKGSLDDFRYWNRALELNEIDSLCNNLVSIEEDYVNPLGEISIYPNPVTDILNVEVKNKSDIKEIVLRNVLGQNVFRERYDSNIDVKHLESGLYFIQLIDNEGTQVYQARILKE